MPQAEYFSEGWLFVELRWPSARGAVPAPPMPPAGPSPVASLRLLRRLTIALLRLPIALLRLRHLPIALLRLRRLPVWRPGGARERGLLPLAAIHEQHGDPEALAKVTSIDEQFERTWPGWWSRHYAQAFG